MDTFSNVDTTFTLAHYSVTSTSYNQFIRRDVFICLVLREYIQGRLAAGAKNVMEWILQPIFMKIPILETHWHQEEPWQMSLTYIEVLWICPLDRRLFKLQFVNSVCKICQNLNRKRGNNSISCLKHCFLKNNMWKNKQNTTTWYKCRVFCWDFDTFCRLN